IERDVDIGNTIQQPIKQGSGRQFEPAFTFAFGAYRIYNLVPLTPFAKQFGDKLRRILKISVDQDDSLTLRVIHPSGYCNLMPKVPGEPNDPDMCRVLVVE